MITVAAVAITGIGDWDSVTAMREGRPSDRRRLRGTQGGSAAGVLVAGRYPDIDHIEHEPIRSENGHREPRIHFALNCASASCPALRPLSLYRRNASRSSCIAEVLAEVLVEQHALFDNPTENR